MFSGADVTPAVQAYPHRRETSITARTGNGFLMIRAWRGPNTLSQLQFLYPPWFPLQNGTVKESSRADNSINYSPRCWVFSTLFLTLLRLCTEKQQNKNCNSYWVFFFFFKKKVHFSITQTLPNLWTRAEFHSKIWLSVIWQNKATLIIYYNLHILTYINNSRL